MAAIEESEQADLRAIENEAPLGVTTSPAALASVTTTYAQLRESFQRRGAGGYWRQRLEIAQSAPKPNPHYISTVLARLGQVNEAYA